MTEEQNDDKPVDLGRRHFLRSIFGLGTVADSLPSEAAPVTAPPKKGGAAVPGKFYWANLRNGQMGFPCGHSVPNGMPGSIMKLVTVAALTDAKIMSADEKFECRGTYKLHNETYQCQHAHGIVDMVHALGLSCNIYFAHASQKISASTILDYAARFGLDQPVASFGNGKFPTERHADTSTNYVLGLAEDLQPSALQLLRVAGLIANKGKLPYLHSAEQPVIDAKPFELHLSEASWTYLQQGMQIASREGTGKKLDPENKMHISVKTGTTPHGKTFQSWICGYFPWNEPRYAFVLRAPSGTSQDEAVPQARSWLFAAEW